MNGDQPGSISVADLAAMVDELETLSRHVHKRLVTVANLNAARE